MNRTFGIALLLAGLIVGLSIGAVVAPKPVPSKPETYQVTSSPVTMVFLVNTTASATCNSGDSVTGGGYEIFIPSLQNDVLHVSSLPFVTATAEGWEVTAVLIGQQPVTYTLTATAVCVVLHK